MSTRSRLGFSLLTSFGLLALFVGCSNQGEGERCDTANGNLDCQAGLLCRRIGAATYDLCCPPADQTPSATACTNVIVTPTADAAADVSDDGDDRDVKISDDASDANSSDVRESSVGDEPASRDASPEAAAGDAGEAESGADL